MVNENKDDPDKKRAKERAKFLEECIGDMQTPFSDVRGEVLDMIQMGFKIMVPQFKARTGYDKDHSFNSKHHDGKIGWKNFTPIDPETVERWSAPEGTGYLGLTGVVQRLVRNGKELSIPRNRMLLFRSSTSNNSPIGKSLLEGAYNDWTDLVLANKIQMVGLKRSLEGIPYARIHTKLAKDSKNNPAAKAAIKSAKAAVINLDASKDTAFVLPADRDDKGHLLVEVGLMGAQEGGGNTKIQDAKLIIDAKEQSIARSMLAQFMTIQGKGGSYALSKTQSEVFINSLKMYMNQIADIMNQEAIPRLFAVNGEGIGRDDNFLPTLSFSEFIKDDMTEFFTAMQKSIEAGIFEVTPQIQKKAAQVLGIDASEQEELLSDRKAKAAKFQESMVDAGTSDEDVSEGDESASSGIDNDTDVPDTKKGDITDKGLKDILEE